MYVNHQLSREGGDGKSCPLRLVRLGASWLDIIGYGVVCILAGYLLFLISGLERPSGDTSSDKTVEIRDAIKPALSAPNLVFSGGGRKQAVNQRFTHNRYTDGHPNQFINRLSSYQELPLLAISDVDLIRFRDDLNRIRELGTSAIPAINDFLLSGIDVDYQSMGLAESFGYPSLRLAIFKVLSEVGGTSAENIFYHELRSTNKVLEVEALASYLSQAAPSLYDYDIIQKAKDTFSSIRQESDEPQDTGPLFRLFSEYGDANLVTELENISQFRWGKYGAVALSRIEGGDGIASLANWAQEGPVGNKSSTFALRILAQESDDPVAGHALLKSVAGNRIGDADWKDIAQLIAGTYHIQLEPPQQGVTTRHKDAANSYIIRTTEYVATTPGGGQRLYGLETGSPVLAPDQVMTRLELIDELLAEVQSPAARRELEKAFEVLWSMAIKMDQK